MFGYIQPDMPYLYGKDATLYKAMYCGLCKSIGASCGQRARFALSFDMTFLSALLHNIMNTDVHIEKAHCVLHPIVKRPVAGDDAITRAVACLNTAFTYYKLSDDVADALAPIQKKRAELLADKAYLESVMKSGAGSAFKAARRTLSKVYRKIGFYAGE